MNCEEVHQNFDAFIGDRLSVNDTDEFIRHVSSCRDCYDELEVYYMIQAVTGELKEDLESYDLVHLLSDKLAERRRYVRRRQRMHFVFALLAALLLIAAVYALLYFFK